MATYCYFDYEIVEVPSCLETAIAVVTTVHSWRVVQLAFHSAILFAKDSGLHSIITFMYYYQLMLVLIIVTNLFVNSQCYAAKSKKLSDFDDSYSVIASEYWLNYSTDATGYAIATKRDFDTRFTIMFTRYDVVSEGSLVDAVHANSVVIDTITIIITIAIVIARQRLAGAAIITSTSTVDKLLVGSSSVGFLGLSVALAFMATFAADANVSLSFIVADAADLLVIVAAVALRNPS